MSSGITLSDGRTIDSDTVNVLAGGAGVSLSTISNSNQLTSLTAEQVAALIAQIDGLISTQNQTIISTQSLVTMLQTSIDTPVYGLRAVYNSTIQSYSTAVIDYNTKLGLIDAASHRLSSFYSTLSSIIIQEGYDISTMNGYATEYSTFLTKIGLNDGALGGQISLYNSLSTTRDSYVSDYMIKATSLQSATNPTTMSTLSTTMGIDTSQSNTYSTLIQSTLYNISTMSFLSTSYQDQSNSYSTDPLYNSIRDRLFDPVTGLLAEQARIVSSISEYENKLFWLNQSTTTEYSKLNSGIGTFYTKKLTQIQNQVLATQYSVQEWESFIGYVTTQLALEKLQLYNSIDLLNYQNQQSPDPAKVALAGTQQGHQTSMQSIIDSLNPLPAKISNIYQNITAELQLRSTFIGNKRALAAIEVNVFSSPSLKESYRTAYVPLAGTLAQNASDIVTSQNARVSLIQGTNSLMSIFNAQWPNIQNLRNYITFIQPNPIYPAGLTSEVPFNSDPTEFNVFTPLNY